MVKLEVGCKKHPRYRGILEPKVGRYDCGCWSVWELINLVHPPGLLVERLDKDKEE